MSLVSSGRWSADKAVAALAVSGYAISIVLPAQADLAVPTRGAEKSATKASESSEVSPMASVPSASGASRLDVAHGRHLSTVVTNDSASVLPLNGPVVRNDDSTIGRGMSVGIVLGMYAGLHVLAYLAWYADAPRDRFQWSNDGWFGASTYAGGSDKMGHFYMTHFLTRANAGVLESGGWHPRSSTYAGAMLTLGAYYVIEMQDGFTFGFSKNDTIANIAGAASGVLFREVPTLDKMFDLRVEYLPSSGYLRRIKKDGFNFNEDYNGLTFLLAWHLCSLPWVEQNGGALRFMDLVLGYNTQHYKPRPDGPHPTRYQDRFIGISLNLQRIVDELWMGERHPTFGASAGRAHGFMHFATEFFNIPYTSLRLGTWRTEYHGHVSVQFNDP
jgi:hypothetical protein